MIERMFPGRPEPPEQRIEAAVLRVLLIEQPDRLSVRELMREIGELAPCERAVADAIDQLERAGLVHRQGKLASLSRAARYFDRLRIY
jgi:hypothetical protein